ncbi:MAG: endonuclease domain-containing protein [Alphaproteobacteria bacterium]|nr:MAG: endonuclease domain-containing protein [Alphaproteobacteria bacterium]
MPKRDPKKLARARELRANMSPPERALWSILRAHRLEGIKFSRQVECGPYYIDFAARMERLAIELDGDSHAGREREDVARTRYLEAQGWRVIRFTNADAMGNEEGVGRAILLALGRDF